MTAANDRLIEVAHALDVLAARCEHALALVDANDRQDVWTGGKATDFHDQLRSETRAVARSSDRLRDTANRLRIRACLPGDLLWPGA